MKKFTRAAGVILTASLMTAGAMSTANAAATPDVADRLDQIAQVVDPVPLKSSPVDAVSGGKVRLGGTKSTQIRLGLPASTSKPTRDDGRYLLDGAKGSSIAVAPTKDGVQVLVGIESSQAPTTYAFDVDAPAGFAPVLGSDGSVAVVDADGRVAAQIETPWAIDAEGRRVPTRFELKGDRITQVVDHRAGDFAYPIVADPKVFRCDLMTAWCVRFSKSETKAIARAYVAAGSLYAMAAKICNLLPHKLISVGCIGAVTAAGLGLAKSFKAAAKAGKCVELHFLGVATLYRWKTEKC